MQELPYDELNSLFEKCRYIEPVPDVTRARVLVRARACLETLRADRPVTELPGALNWRRVVVAAVAIFAAMATGAAAALIEHVASISHLQQSATERAKGTAPAAATQAVAVAGVDAPLLGAGGRRHARPGGAGEALAGELTLMRQAQAAYASADDPAVLRLLAEHLRRYPNGRLAEEREALSVRSLLRSGRPQEARRALDAFADHFPQSVLLPSLRRASVSGP